MGTIMDAYPQPLDPTELVTVGSDKKKRAEAELRLRLHLCKVLDLPEEVLEDNLIEKYGTAEGAKRSWIRRRWGLKLQLQNALARRDANAVAKIQRQIGSGDSINKHLPGKHNQQDHGRRDIVTSIADFKTTKGLKVDKEPFDGLGYRLADGTYVQAKRTHYEVNEAAFGKEFVGKEIWSDGWTRIQTMHDENEPDLDLANYVTINTPITGWRSFKSTVQDYKKNAERLEITHIKGFFETKPGTFGRRLELDVSDPDFDKKLEDFVAVHKFMPQVDKHLPGRHNQKDHGRLGEHSAFYEKEKGAEAAAKELGGIVTKIKNAYSIQHEDDNANSAVAKTHHIRRETVGVREETKTLKNGEIKKVVVPTYKFYDSISGKEITSKKDLERLNKAAPPGVNHVRINPDPEAHLVASWTDNVGRAAAMRSKQHTIGAAAEKFQRLKNFHKELPKIRKQIEEDVDAGNEEAAVLYLIDKTAFRAGSGADTNAKVQAYGASTLLNKHVKVDGDKVTFDFIGKKGVRIQKSLRDAKLAEIVNKRKTSQYSQPLFGTNYGQVMKYLKSVAGDYKIHDFRTHNGTSEALKWVKKRKGPAPSEKVFSKWQKEVAEKVGQHLGNNRSMALNSYIDPHVWDTWRQPEWGQWVPKSQREE